MSSVYNSSVMVKDFFLSFSSWRVLEPVSLGMPQSWGFSGKYFFKYFFLHHVLFHLWDTDGTNVGAFLLSQRPPEGLLAGVQSRFLIGLPSVHPPFFCHLRPARDSICDISTPVILFFSSQNCVSSSSLAASLLTETSNPSICFRVFALTTKPWLVKSIFAMCNVFVISALMSVD